MPYLFEHEKAFLCIVAFTIMVVLYLRVRVARTRRRRDAVRRNDRRGDEGAV